MATRPLMIVCLCAVGALAQGCCPIYELFGSDPVTCFPHSPSPADVTEIVVNLPEPDEVFGGSSAIEFKATATNLVGLKSLQLHAGAVGGISDTLLTTCEAAGTGQESLICEFNISVATNGSVIGMGSITLTAEAFDLHGLKTTKAITVRINPITCEFLAPAITPGTSPLIANVSATSLVAVEVGSALSVATVQITYDSANTVLVQWNNSPAPTTAPDIWASMVDWDMTIGSGMHLLTCAATDSMGNISTATLGINVDADAGLSDGGSITDAGSSDAGDGG